MTNIWITSDTHFNHENILSFKDNNGNLVRNFSSIEEMNETIIERWNSLVKKGDKVYHLGDVFFGNRDWINFNWPRLNGSKRLIVGNHDDVKFLSGGGFFKKVSLWRMFPEFGILLTHVPVHEGTLTSRTKGIDLLNVHGHTHQNDVPSELYRNVCVEKTDYYPVNIEELNNLRR